MTRYLAKPDETALATVRKEEVRQMGGLDLEKRNLAGFSSGLEFF